MELTYRNTTLVKLIDDVANTLDEVVAWPESKLAEEAADRAIALLRKGWK